MRSRSRYSSRGRAGIYKGNRRCAMALIWLRRWRRRRFVMSVIARCPLFKKRLQRLLLCPVDNLAAFPRNGLDQFLDCRLNAVAKIIGVHRIEFPTAVSVIGPEPLEARVLPFVRCRERWQPAHMLSCQRNSP